MAYGKWSVIHENALYEYMTYRFRQNLLRLRKIIQSGNFIHKEVWVKVEDLEINNTRFPDIDRIILNDDVSRVAEVKFNTSLYKYHVSLSPAQYRQFIQQQGCIIVLRHDCLPQKLLEVHPSVDVFELDHLDFISFIKENLITLLNRQLKIQSYQKVWLMQQSKNFYYKADVSPACESGLWCPSDNIQNKLSVNDLILFIRHRGSSYQKVAAHWKRNGGIITGWEITDICIANVIEPMRARDDFCSRKGWDPQKPLWYDETDNARKDSRVRNRESKWPYIFMFSPKFSLTELGINLIELYATMPEFVLAVKDIYTAHVSREISYDTYTKLMEYIVCKENRRK